MDNGLADLRDHRPIGAWDDRAAVDITARGYLRRGEEAGDGVDQRDRAETVVRRAREDGDDLIVRAIFAEVGANFVRRRFDAIEEFFHEMIVEVGERLEQGRARAVDARLQVRRNRDGLLGALTRVETCRVLREVDVAVEVFAAADREMRGDDVPAVRVAERRQRRRKIRAGPVELVDKKEVRKFPHLEVFDQCRRLRDAARLTVHDDDGRICGEQRELRLLEEVDEARGVDDIDVDLTKTGVREATAHALHVFDGLGLAIGNRRALLHGAAARDRAAACEQRFDQSGLAGMVRADEGDVSKTCDVGHADLLRRNVVTAFAIEKVLPIPDHVRKLYSA
jgi:hypothetical protein